MSSSSFFYRMSQCQDIHLYLYVKELLLVAWLSFPVGEATQEPHSVMAVDVPEVVMNFMESHNDPGMFSKMRSL
jgi:hypothetical protein